MSHNVETMAFVGQVPWWGMGVDLKDLSVGDQVKSFDGAGVGTFLGADGTLVSGEAMLKAAGLDWNVVLFPAQSLTPNGLITIPDQFGVFRDSDWTGLGVVGKKYTPIQNSELFGIPDTLVSEGRISYNTAGSLGNGKTVWALADLGEYSIRRRNGFDDITKRYLLWTGDHTGNASVIGGFTDVRVVCNNTLDAAMGYKGNRFTNRINIRHTASGPARIKQAHGVLLKLEEEGKKFQAILQQLADTPMSKEDMVLFGAAWLDATWGELDKEAEEYQSRAAKREEVVAELFNLFTDGKGNTGSDRFDAYNAVTEWLDHNRARYETGRTMAQQARHMASTLSGDRFKRKGKALQLLTK